MSRLVCLCVEVPDDLGSFDSLELIQDNGKSFFLFYKGKKVFCSVFPEYIWSSSGDLKFIVERMIKFFGHSNYEDFQSMFSHISKDYEKCCLKERLHHGLQKKDEKELVSEKFPARSRSKKS